MTGILLVLCLWLVPANADAAGTVVAWGSNRYGQTDVPAGLSGVTAIAAGDSHTVALKSDGTVVAWGYNSDGTQTTVPSGLNGVTAIAGGAVHTVALIGGAGGGAPPVITAQPTNVIASTASNATFSVTATGAVPLKFQWRFNGTPIAKATNTFLALTKLTTNKSGLYTVVVTNRFGSVTSAPAQLLVQIRPTIKPQPKGATRTVGSNVTLNVAALGTGPLGHQWQLNATNLPGATSSNLTLVNLQTNQSGLYRVVVANAVGSITSQVAIVNVGFAPTILASPTNQTVIVKSNALHSATVTGSAPLKFQWFKNSAKIAGATNATLLLTNVALTTAGKYYVTVTNLFGKVNSSTGLLTVIQPVTITGQPGSLTVKTNAKATFTVRATGTAPLRYQWFFNDAPLPLATNASFVVTNAQFIHRGVYFVTVSNAAGAVRSTNVALNLTGQAPVDLLFAQREPLIANVETAALEFRLTIERFANAPVRIVFEGPPGAWELESSPDLLNWERITSFMNETATAFELPSLPHPQQFFRVKPPARTKD